MKKIKILSFSIFVISIAVFANSQSFSKHKGGIYLTYQDYINHHISYNNSDKIILNQLLASSNIKIVENSKIVELKKNEIFGYCDKNNQDFRFYNNELYKIVINDYLFIYSFYSSSNEEKGKGWIKKQTYYFSITGNSELVPLTVANLKKAFPNNLKFHDLLDDVKSDEDLCHTDEYTHDIKVNYLLKKSLKN